MREAPGQEGQATDGDLAHLAGGHAETQSRNRRNGRGLKAKVKKTTR